MQPSSRGAGHPLAGAGPASIDSLLDENWIVREPGSGTRQTLDRAMTPYWARWKIALELEHTEAIKGMNRKLPYRAFGIYHRFGYS